MVGRLADPEAGAALGMQRLNANPWSLQVNDAWVQGGIDARRSFYLGSPIRFNTLRPVDRSLHPTTVYYRELRQLREAGYYRQGDYMVPPRRN